MSITGVVCVLLLLSVKMAGMGAKFFGLHDVAKLLTKTFLNAWKSVKVCARTTTVFRKGFYFVMMG